MRGYHNRQLILFLAILILPTAAIILQGRMIASRDRELAETHAHERVTDIQKRVAAEIAQDMLAQLERIKGQEIANAENGKIPQPGEYSDPAVVLVGRLNGNRLSWPWNYYAGSDPRHLVYLSSMKMGSFAQKVEEARNEKDPRRASDLYRELIRVARLDEELAYARLGLAKALKQAGQRQEAIAMYRRVLETKSTVVDESRISFASLAAAELAEMDAVGKEVLDRVKEDLESGRALLQDQTTHWQMALEVLQKSADKSVQGNAASLREQLLKRARALEDAMKLEEFGKLQSEFPAMSITATSWQPFHGRNNEVWLVGRAADRSFPSGNRPEELFGNFFEIFTPLVIVVRADGLLPPRRAPVQGDIESDRASRQATEKFRIELDGQGEPLSNDHLPRLKVTFPDLKAEALAEFSLGQSFYAWSFLSVVPLTFLCGYLVWRDTQREVRIANLRSQFVSSVSHELRTPLTAIRMFAEALQMKYAADPRIHEEYLETIVNESERLTRLLDNVLGFSRMDRGQKGYRMESARLPEVVRAAARTMQYPLGQQGFVLALNIDDNIPPVMIDRDAIQQAILNLISNAMKYSGSRREIELSLLSEGEFAIIRVTDHGIGIPAHEQARIFEAFYRSPIPENQAIAGTGLGLALISHAVKAHRGTVQVKSSPGEGATFSIHLPLDKGGAA